MKLYIKFFLLSFLFTTMTSCEVIGGIFKAGFWIGVIAVVVVVGLILWAVNKII